MRIGLMNFGWLIGFLSVIASTAHGAPPNIVFFFSDDQRADTIAALGNRVIRTPHLDQLTRQGLSFQRAYMQGAMNGATCVPSRAMLLSGRPLLHVDETLKGGAPWPKAFAKAGYTTFISGKWHNGPESASLSFDRGRSLFLGGMTDPFRVRVRDLDQGQLGQPRPCGKHSCEAFADEAIAFLKNHQSGPFFLYLPFNGPHDPHIVPEDFPVRYSPDQIPLPADFLPQHPFDNGEMTVRDEALLPWPRSQVAIRQMLADYYRYISFVDAQVGRVLETLTHGPHAQNTLVVFAADSGVARGSHGLIGKQNLYEHSLRVPLILSGPGIPANRQTQAMIYLHDLLPTLGELCAVQAPPESEGMSWKKVVEAPESPGRKQLFFAYRQVQRAVREDRWKLIRYPRVDRTQLFDLQADPHETKDLASLPEHQKTVADLMNLLVRQQAEHGDKTPLKVKDPMSGEWTPPKKSGNTKKNAPSK